jgi:hypothetical protein
VLRSPQGRKLVANSADSRAWGARLLGGPVLYFPIRHHSPACAWHLERLIEERRPETVLIEGPSNFDTFRDLLADAQSVPPVALYSYCNRVVPSDGAAPEAGGPGDPRLLPQTSRRGAYYPLSAYSPEWVALRAAQRIGAEVRFIDLTFAAQTVVDHSERLTGRVATLLAEHWFQRSAYLRSLAASRGCRDVDELWDRLFESWARDIPTHEFVSQVATYCELARRGVTDQEHQHDGTTAREAEMAWHIARETCKNPGRTVLVVTGGYHTMTLPQLVASEPDRPQIDQSTIEAPNTVLIRYSFDRLDRANGYGAGMPAPALSPRPWEASDKGTDVPLTLLTDISQRAREESLEGAPTTVSVSAALEQTYRLAALRGNRAATRSDLLDAIESCYLQGAPQGEGRAIAELVRSLFTGSTVGRVPAAAGLPPIVADFYAQAKACGLKVDDTESRQLALDVYSDVRARQTSRVLHRLHFIEIPFAARLSGPNFAAAHVGRRLREVWRYGWSPQTDSALVDAAAYGSTIREAVTQRFADTIKPNADDGSTRSAQVAAERLSTACLLGLHDVVPRIVQWLGACVREDPEFVSVTSAVHRLALLWQAREPLEAVGLEDVPLLARAAFERAAYLATDLGLTPADAAHAVAGALISLRELLTGGVSGWFDADLLWRSVEQLARQPTGEASVLGAAAGMLYSAGRVDDAGLGRLLQGRLAQGAAPGIGVAYLRGLLLAARELAWQSAAVISVLRSVVESGDESAFVRALPELRLALSALRPSETDRMAQVIATVLGVRELQATVEYAFTEAEVQRNLELTLQVHGILDRDGLGSWIAGQTESV